jgi:hypothetical protein
MKLGMLIGLVLVGLVHGVTASAQSVPSCLDDHHQALALNNAQVVQWRESTRDRFQSRAFVQGIVTNIYPDRTGHTHFALNLDQDQGGDIEIIYNQEFGALPDLRPGMTVVACGDYITAGPRSQLPSPMGAIIHWVHYNPGNRDGGVHPNGFLLIDGRIYGFSPSGARNEF